MNSVLQREWKALVLGGLYAILAGMSGGFLYSVFAYYVLPFGTVAMLLIPLGEWVGVWMRLGMLQGHARDRKIHLILSLFSGVYCVIAIWISYLWIASGYQVLTFQLPDLWHLIFNELRFHSPQGPVTSLVLWGGEALIVFGLIFYVSSRNFDFPHCEKCLRNHNAIFMATRMAPLPIYTDVLIGEIKMRDISTLTAMRKMQPTQIYELDDESGPYYLQCFLQFCSDCHDDYTLAMDLYKVNRSNQDGTIEYKEVHEETVTKDLALTPELFEELANTWEPYLERVSLTYSYFINQTQNLKNIIVACFFYSLVIVMFLNP